MAYTSINDYGVIGVATRSSWSARPAVPALLRIAVQPQKRELESIDLLTVEQRYDETSSCALVGDRRIELAFTPYDWRLN